MQYRFMIANGGSAKAPVADHSSTLLQSTSKNVPCTVPVVQIQTAHGPWFLNAPHQNHSGARQPPSQNRQVLCHLPTCTSNLLPGQQVTYGILGPETADPHAIGSPLTTATL